MVVVVSCADVIRPMRFWSLRCLWARSSSMTLDRPVTRLNVSETTRSGILTLPSVVLVCLASGEGHRPLRGGVFRSMQGREQTAPVSGLDAHDALTLTGTRCRHQLHPASRGDAVNVENGKSGSRHDHGSDSLQTDRGVVTDARTLTAARRKRRPRWVNGAMGCRGESKPGAGR